MQDVPGPQIKLNVGQLEAQKRKEIVDVATQMAEQWSKEDKKELARDKSDESLANLINGKKPPIFFVKTRFYLIILS